MTPHGTITVERMDGSAAAQAEDAFGLVYADVFAEPPYNETVNDVATTFRRGTSAAVECSSGGTTPGQASYCSSSATSDSWALDRGPR